MLRYSKYLLGFAALANATPKTQGPGFGVSVSQNGVNQGLNVIIPYAFQYIGDIQIEEVDFDGGYLKNIEVQIMEPATQDVNVNFLHASNGAELTVQNAQVALTSDFHYKYLFITVDGKADIKINKAAIDMELDTSTQQSTPSYELAPKLDAKTFKIDVNPNDIDIQLTGGLVAKIANVLIPLLKNSVIPSLITQVETTVISTINDKVDQDLKVYGSQEEIPYLGGVTADYAQIGGPQFTDASIFQMGVNGTFFDAQHIKAPSTSPAAFNIHDPKGKDGQAYLTEYTITTALESGFTTGNTLDITYLLQEYLNLTVTTDNLSVLIPEILTKYGSGKAVGLSGKFVIQPSTVSFTDGKASATGNLQVTVTVDQEQAIQATFANLNAAAAINTKNGVLFGNLAPVSIGSIDASSFVTTLGIDASHLQTEIQSQVDTAIAQANKNLTAGIQVPIVDLDVEIHQGYAMAGASVTPTMWTSFTSFMRRWYDYLVKMKNAAPMSKIQLEKTEFIQF